MGSNVGMYTVVSSGRASLHAGGISRDVEYIFQSLAKVMNEIDRRDDLIAPLGLRSRRNRL